MISKQQQIERLKKMSNILEQLPQCHNIGEISNKLNIPTSTIQRYLNRTDYFQELSEFDIIKEHEVEKILDYTRDWLKSAKEEGLKRGGINSQLNNGFSKDENGKFNGNLR